MSLSDIKKIKRQLSREQGAISKDWGGRLPLALIYPNTYYVGMSNLGFHTIYSLLNGYDHVVCERAFWEKDKAARGLPAISLESRRPLTDYAVLAFSISYELDYFHAVQILKSSGIPLYAADRNENHPLVIAGGPCVIANPQPLSPFFDCFGIGEAEAILPAMLPILYEGAGGKRADLLQALGSLPGIYVPLLNNKTPVTRQWVRSLDDYTAASAILTPDTELGNLYLMEVERGCNHGCRFCLTSQAFRPMRSHSLDKLMSQAETGLKYRKRLGLVGAAVQDYPRIEELVSGLRQMGAELAISSLRIKPLSNKVLSEVAQGQAHTITLAPEAGSQRLREVIKKDITEDDIFRAMDNVAEHNFRELKLYFMIGLPTETEADIEATNKLVLNCKSILERRQRSPRISLNIAPFVPKATTPFQWLPMQSTAVINQRLSLLRKSLSPKGINIKWESPAWSEIQAALARGDETLARILANIEEVSLSGWHQAVQDWHVDMDFYAHQRWKTGEKLPWSIIDCGLDPAHLKRELERALRETPEPAP